MLASLLASLKFLSPQLGLGSMSSQSDVWHRREGRSAAGELGEREEADIKPWQGQVGNWLGNVLQKRSPVDILGGNAELVQDAWEEEMASVSPIERESKNMVESQLLSPFLHLTKEGTRFPAL